jgi:adenylate cyclase
MKPCVANLTPETLPMRPVGVEAPQIAVEPLLTVHRLIETCPGHPKGLEFLHIDLFDSRPAVALSALAAVRVLADIRSFPYVARLIDSADEELQFAAVRALGSIRHPDTAKLLLDLLKTTRNDKLHRELLEALSEAAPQDKEIASIIRQVARMAMGSAGSRAHAARLLLHLGGRVALEELLVDAREEVLDQILYAATEDATLAPRTVAHCAPLYARLATRSRAALVMLAARQQLPESSSLLCESFSDPHAEVRRAAYSALGSEPHHAGWASALVAKMSLSVESNPALEDEAQQALSRLGRIHGIGEMVAPDVRVGLIAQITVLFGHISAVGRRISSDTHELGWLITRSKDYVEYYFDDDLKASLLRWLKGASSETAESLLKQLKATAVRVEVRHFEGYSAISDLIKNPKRSGIALVARELALAKTGKSREFWQLIRALRLATIFLSPAAPAGDREMLKTIYTWARQEKLYRLAEAGLCALAKVDVRAAEAACKECLALPLASKILAIASLHLLRELSVGLVEPEATRMLASQDDPYVTLNALEVLSAGSPSSSPDLARALLSRLSLTDSREVREAISLYLGEKISLDFTESLKEPCLSGDDALRAAALSVLERRITSGHVANRDGTIEFLYRLLRGEHEPSRRSAALMLWKMGDNYALEVLRDFLANGTEEGAVEILRRLQGNLCESLVTTLSPLFSRDCAPLQEALRDLLISAQDKSLCVRGLEFALHLHGDPTEEEEDEIFDEAASTVEVRTERSSFQFERENMQELVMFFSDIVGYSKKAQVLTPMQLSSLIQEYEKILLVNVEAHGGELVKRMGDGHMIVFHEPLPAVLAAIRLQKSLLRFNRYRDENTRVVIRIGIHCGRVVRKAQGDVLGNAVNIASRLESSARPGSILISDLVHEKVKDFVHAREIGHIMVKNILGPINVFEPYEIVLDLPAELDPLKTSKTASPEGISATASMVTLDQKTYMDIIRCFSSLISICNTAKEGEVTVAALRDQVLNHWGRIRPLLPRISSLKKVPG